MVISNFKIADNRPPFIIAEMSGNHNQSLSKALEIVEAAAKAGANAIKLQTYTADTMTTKGAHIIEDKSSLWQGRELYELYQQAYTPWEWHKAIFDKAKSLGITAFSSPFDETSVDFLEELGVPCYKIASFENTDWPLLKKVASTGKPVIMSTGVSNISDIDESVRVLRAAGCKDLVLLKCTSTYPASPESTNLNTIPHLRNLFDCVVGLSDHTMGIGASIAAVALGARVIEKHFTISRSEGGVDSAFSLEPAELRSLVIEADIAFKSLGAIQYGIDKSEIKSQNFKRSLFATVDIHEGEIFNTQNVKVLRPGTGLPPKYHELIIGRKARTHIKKGSPITWENF